ncbi:MAG: M1 family metallopeptidase, partial [Anaerolineales bacterium]|nr:M1 family metallopeptidase [Anaerolineales bacterium]
MLTALLLGCAGLLLAATVTADVRQVLGRPGEIWATDKLAVIRAAGSSESPILTPAWAEESLPTSSLFEVAWADRSLYRTGLITAEQAVLDGLPGASVYHLDVQLSDDLVRLQGREEVHYTNREDKPLAEVYFRLFPNLADGSATVSSIKVNGLAVEPEYELEQSAMRVPLAPPLPPGESLVFQLEFAVQVPAEDGGNYGTFAFKDGVLALAHFYPLIAVYDAEGWNVEIAPYIGDVIYADTSFYLARVTAPISQTLVASGREINREQNETQQTVTFAAGPVRDFYLVASDRYTVTSRTVGETTVNSYAPTELAAGGEIVLDQAEAALQSFNTRFGPYPFTEFDLVSTTNFALGVEYPGIVALLIDLYDPAGRVRGAATTPLLEGVVAHEVAHQWFYSQVGNDQVDEPWLDEALAQYATILYYQDVYGDEGAAGFRRSLERRWQRVNRADIPIGLPVAGYDESSYGAIVYGRGPLFIEQLAETMGQETFAAFLRDYYKTHLWGIATGDSFK